VGIAPIRRSGDERLQAVAFGRMREKPRVAVLLDPLDPGDPGLEEAGDLLDDRLRDPGGCQLWLPDGEGLRALAVEGARARSRRVPAGRSRFGACCRALARIHALPGQQAVAVATAVLADHLVTGQTPSEDAHLGARLAWDAPLPGVPPTRLAAVRRGRPGPSLLPVEAEDRVESLRARIRSGRAEPDARDEVAWLLSWWAEEAWLLLEAAWHAYGALPLPPLPGIGELERDSRTELEQLLEGVPRFDAHLGRAVAELGKREAWRARFEDLNVRGDPVWREISRREGRVVSASVRRARGRTLLLRTGLGPRRLRVGTRVKDEQDRVEGVVAAIRPDDAGAWISVRVTRGKTASLPVGEGVDWLDTVVFRGRSPRVSGADAFAGAPPGGLPAPSPGPAVPCPPTGNCT
jgi:hypothetical protein